MYMYTYVHIYYSLCGFIKRMFFKYYFTNHKIN